MKNIQQPVLELNEATVRWDQKNILDQISLKIHLGENTAIIGPNGSGKSTLIKLLMHDIYPLTKSDGSDPIKMFGQSTWNVEDLRAKMSIISSDLQNNFLHNTKGGRISGMEAVLTGFFSSLRLFPHFKVTKEMKLKAKQALGVMEAEQLSRKMLRIMSTGELRRVLIARAMVTSPKVLILDEPTTSLDFMARQIFMTQIRKIVQSGTTLILVTHHIEEVIPEISRIVLLKNGGISFDGSKKEVLTSEILSQVFDGSVSLSEENGVYSVKSKVLN